MASLITTTPSKRSARWCWPNPQETPPRCCGEGAGDFMEHQYFYCYSNRLMRALRANGFRYICVGINMKTGSRFYLYESSAEFQNFKDTIYPKVRDQF